MLREDLKTISFHFFFFLAYVKAYGILGPQPGIKAMPPAVEVRSPNHISPNHYRLCMSR